MAPALVMSMAGDSDNLKKAVTMNDSASNHPPGSPGPGRARPGNRRAALQVLVVSLLVALAAACTGGQDIGEEAGGVESVDVMFPQHDVPPTDYWSERFVGQLTLEDGCLRAATLLLIWPNTFTFDTKNGVVRIVDATGRIVAHVGDDVRFSRTNVSFEQALDQEWIHGLSGDCSGPYWLVADEVAAVSHVDPVRPPDPEGPEVFFPQHGAPLGTDDGGSYWAGQLILDDGCLRVEVPPDVNGPRGSSLLIWPSGYTLSAEDRVVRVADDNGRVAAHVGDHIRLSRATVSYKEAQDQGLLRGMTEECAGPYFLVGDEVTAFNPENELRELRLSDPDVFFPRQKTIIATMRDQMTAGGGGELVLDGQCLRLNGRTTVIWPAGFKPHVHQGVVQVRNGAGRVIAQVGDKLSMGGGYFSRDEDWECPGGVFVAHSIEIVPDPSPILQQAGYGGTLRDPDDRGILYVRLVNPFSGSGRRSCRKIRVSLPAQEDPGDPPTQGAVFSRTARNVA